MWNMQWRQLRAVDDSGIEEEFGREQVEYEQFLHM